MFCHPSLEESQGMCLLEAMAARLPIVAGAKSGAVSWTLFDGAGGTLVDVRRTSAISEGIHSVLTSNAKSSAAAAQVTLGLMQSRYSPVRVAQQYLEAYETLIEEHRRNNVRRALRRRLEGANVGV